MLKYILTHITKQIQQNKWVNKKNKVKYTNRYTMVNCVYLT